MERVDFIRHIGIVKEVDAAGKNIVVALGNMEDCGGCPASTLCSLSGDAANIVRIPVENPSLFKVDDEVTVEGSERLHRKAVTLVTVIPSVLLIAVMTGVFILTGNQLWACLSGLGAMIVFFIVLWIIRDHLSHEFVFEVTEIL